jgi:hypothetical protein
MRMLLGTWLLPLALLAAETPVPGPAVGTRVPDFRLADQTGAMRDLDSLAGPKGLMLVFYRSADW